MQAAGHISSQVGRLGERLALSPLRENLSTSVLVRLSGLQKDNGPVSRRRGRSCALRQGSGNVALPSEVTPTCLQLLIVVIVHQFVTCTGVSIAPLHFNPT